MSGNDKMEAGGPSHLTSMYKALCLTVKTEVLCMVKGVNGCIYRGYRGNYATKHLSFYGQIGLQMSITLMTKVIILKRMTKIMTDQLSKLKDS